MSFMDKAKDTAEDLKDKAGDLVDKVPDPVKETASDLKGKAGDLVGTVKEKLGIGEAAAGIAAEEKAADTIADPTAPTTTKTSD